MFGFYFLFQVFYFYEIDLSSNHRMDPERDLVLRCMKKVRSVTQQGMLNCMKTDAGYNMLHKEQQAHTQIETECDMCECHVRVGNVVGKTCVNAKTPR